MGSDVVIILVLILINAIFAMSETAIISVRRSRLEFLAEQQRPGAAVALQLQMNPDRFLSTIQSGITLISIFAGAFGGAAIADELTAFLKTIPLLQPYAENIALGSVVMLISYASIVLGELVPKTIGLAYSEEIALLTSRPMNLLHKCAYPLAKLLSSSTRVVLALLRLNTSARDTITEDEIKSVLDEGIKSGALEVHERDMVEGVLTLADRPVRLVMTPRVDAICLHLEDDYQMNLKKITGTRHTVFPLVDKSPDAIIGTVDIKDLLQRFATGEKVDLKSLARSPLFIPDNLSALKALQRLKETGNHAGLVLDEYGSFDGIITMSDLTQVITGEATSSVEDLQVHQRDDGSWLIDGRLPIEEVKEVLSIPSLPEEEKGHYETAAGLILALLGRIPTLGECCDWQGFRFEIVDMDGRRIDKLLVTALAQSTPGK